ncbi:hypothetical protein BKA59DRAFT_475564 [Fusarium tricinctum]|uniref:Cell wall glycoprotein n=1 Tax=Fusarium tricinctum TaxID=61284 RepID=A0A8K0RZU8_9HYPO|nr:hypothetical protein BKA59DRAFT_475564 [Fusarium tricinctum]
MIANTRSILVGLVLGAAQLSNASPADSPTDFSSPIYPTATDSIPPLVKPTATQTATASGTPIVDACAQKCIDAHDKCNTAPDANHATCAAEFAGCLNYNPYDGKDGLVYPTACSASSSASASATGAPIDACAQKCIDAHDKCDTAPDANHATCAAEFAECLNYNPYDGKDGTLVYPTACSSATTLASATSKPTGGETSKPAPTETNVIVNGAERVSSVKVAGLVGAIGVAALAFL